MRATMRENEQFRGKEAKAKAAEFAEDQARLQSVLDREQAQDQAERDAVNARRRDMIRHQTELRDQMALEEEAGDRFDSYF